MSSTHTVPTSVEVPGAGTGAAPPSTLAHLFLQARPRHDNPAIRMPAADGIWEDVSFDGLRDAVREIGLGLIDLGIAPGDRVALLGATRAEWTIADGGILCAGATVVPIYQTNSPEECAYVLSHSGARAIVCEDAAQAAKVQAVRDRCPALEHVILMDEAGEGEIPLDTLRGRGALLAPSGLDTRVDAIDPDSPATIVYTSGTTGPPKGCVLTHRNLLSAVEMYASKLDRHDDGPVRIFMFLPLAHSLARVAQLTTIRLGGTLAFWRRDPKVLLDDIKLTAPTYLPSVPRVFEKIRTRALSGVEEAGELQRTMLARALRAGRVVREADRAGRPVSRAERARHAVLDRLVLGKVRQLFGPELLQALTGAAPISLDVLRFFDACGITLLEGYGMTETCAAATLNTPDEHCFGTVGKPLPGVEVQIAPDGEVLMRGPNVFRGYWQDEAATAKTLTPDGWLLSGDLGALDRNGYLIITGRKKDLIITSSGKNITPTNLESALREIRWISQAVVFGDNQPYLVALLTLDPEEAPALAQRLGIEPNVASMSHDPEVLTELRREIEDVNHRFARIEQVKRFAVLDHDLSQADGELTPTLKVKRQKVYGRYADVLAALYEEA